MTPTERILQLRQQRFRKGLPFMINCKWLPTGQAYHEWEDGRVQLVQVVSGRLVVLKELPKKQSKKLILMWYGNETKKQTGYEVSLLSGTVSEDNIFDPSR